jgi:hypothetical protein
MLIGRSCDARSESGDTTEVVMLTEVGKCDRSQYIRPESYLPTGVGHMTGVSFSDRSQAYDQSLAIPIL